MVAVPTRPGTAESPLPCDRALGWVSSMPLADPGPPAYPADVRVIGDGVVTLRPLTPHDLTAVVEQSRDPETVRWTTVPQPYDVADAQEFLERVRSGWQDGSRSTWALERRGEFAGLVVARPRAPGQVEISFATHPAHRGAGLMTRAVRLVSQRALDDGAEVVLWHAQVGNFGSRKVAWRAGFRVAGTLRRAHEHQGTLVDVWAGSLVPGDEPRPRHPWHEPAILDGDGVRLRAFRDSDREALPTSPDPVAARFLPRALPTRADFDGWLLARRVRCAEGESVLWAVVDPESDRLLGSIHLFGLRNPVTAGSGVLGFWLLDSARGRGVLARALDAVVVHAFTPRQEGGLGLHGLEAACAVDNVGSARALRRAGFRLVGTRRGAVAVAGSADGSAAPADGDASFDDALLFDLLASDDRESQRLVVPPPPVLETERLRLRPWRDTDVPSPQEGPDEDSRRFMPSQAQPDADGFAGWLARRRLQMADGTSINWCVADKASDHAMGNITLFRMGPPAERFQGEVGYWLHPPARGRGLISEALERVIGHAFAPTQEGGLGLRRLQAGTDLENLASQLVLARAGFHHIGNDRSAFRMDDGRLADGASFELLSTDPRQARRPPDPATDPLTLVTLEGAGVRLRPWSDRDAPRVVEACRDELSRHWLASLPHPYTLDDASAYVARCRAQAAAGSGLFLAVADRADDRCVGSVALMGLGGIDPTSAEVGYWTHPDARGRGVMTEAVDLIVRHAFAPRDDGGLGLRRLDLLAAETNRASQQVATRNGFVQTGIRRQAERLGDGSYADLVAYDLLASESSAR